MRRAGSSDLLEKWVLHSQYIKFADEFSCGGIVTRSEHLLFLFCSGSSQRAENLLVRCRDRLVCGGLLVHIKGGFPLVVGYDLPGFLHVGAHDGERR